MHWVTVPASRLAKTEVTFAQYDAYVSATGAVSPSDRGWGRGQRPVIKVSWGDAQVYIKWLNGKTGKSYRLPSEAEWEYAARAGSGTKYSCGNRVGSGRANCDGCGSRWDDEQTAPVASFTANRWGLHDMVGNVLEWVQDRWHGSYSSAPSDGSAWESGDDARRVLRGGGWANSPRELRSAYRDWTGASARNISVGFRLAESE